MVQSMTGFGRHTFDVDDTGYSWEIRSVNHRHLDISLRLPDTLRALEMNLRERIGTRLARGKLDATLRSDTTETGGGPLRVDHVRLQQLLDALQQLGALAPRLREANALEVLGWPGVLVPPVRDEDALHSAVLDGLDQALDDLVAHRRREGEALAELLRERSAAVAERAEVVRELRPLVLARQRERLQSRLSELAELADVDGARIEQEMLIAAQRYDIDEELDRLNQHIQEMQSVLVRDEPIGRRLDFLLQEFNREANTIASKAADLDTTRASVDIKVLLEQMREQVQNLE